MSTALSKRTSASAKLAAVTSVPEPKDINYKINSVMWNYDNHGHPGLQFDFTDQVTGLRVTLGTSMASTVEIDLEDSDFAVLEDPLFKNWSFTIEDVAVDSQRKFKTNRVTNSINTKHLGDTADLEWVLGQRPIDMQVGDVFFRLCGIQSQQTTLTLTFEDRVSSKLRQKSGAKSWDRSRHTRAQFVAMLCREAGVEYFIPELDVVQPVEIDLSANGTSTQTHVTGKTISPNAQLTVKGAPATASQKKIASAILGVAHKLNAPYNAMIAMLYAAMGESALGASTGSQGGVFQTTGVPSAYSGGTDYLAQAHGFLTGGTSFGSPGAIAAANRGDPVWQIANETEVNAVWLKSRGDSYGPSFPGGQAAGIAEAQAFVDAYGGPSTTGSSSSTSTSTGNYAFTRGANEDSWDCIQRLGSEVAWYAFARQNKLWFVSGNYLFQQESQLAAEVNKDGVMWIDVDLDMGARDQIAEVDIYAEASLWAALPGMMIDVVKRGPATGKWMVSQVQANPLNPTQPAQITAYKPIPKRAEPATDNAKTSTTNQAVTAGGGSKVLAAFQAAQALSAKSLVYTKGKRALTPLAAISQGETLFDCSASVSELLWLAGFKLPGTASKAGDWTPVSGDFVPGQAGLVAGKGKTMTIWGGPTHVFIEFNLPGIGHFQGNTVSGQSGFRLFDWNSATITAGWGGPNPGQGGAGPFAPVHYPGT